MNTRMLKKAARSGHYCENRHCVSPSDAKMSWFSKGSQRAKERREWQAEARAAR